MNRLAADKDWLHKATKETAKYWREKRERLKFLLTPIAGQGSEIRKKRYGGVVVTGT
jgi:hypothetical protein